MTKPLIWWLLLFAFVAVYETELLNYFKNPNFSTSPTIFLTSSQMSRSSSLRQLEEREERLGSLYDISIHLECICELLYVHYFAIQFFVGVPYDSDNLPMYSILWKNRLEFSYSHYWIKDVGVWRWIPLKWLINNDPQCQDLMGTWPIPTKANLLVPMLWIYWIFHLVERRYVQDFSDTDNIVIPL